MQAKRMITAVDVHAEGEGGRVITGGMPHLPGASVFEKHVDFVEGGGRTPPDAVVSIDGKAFQDYADIIRSQPVLDHQELKKGPAERYGRRQTPDGWVCVDLTTAYRYLDQRWDDLFV